NFIVKTLCLKRLGATGHFAVVPFAAAKTSFKLVNFSKKTPGSLHRRFFDAVPRSSYNALKNAPGHRGNLEMKEKELSHRIFCDVEKSGIKLGYSAKTPFVPF
ncbi:hypothetical protein TSAR_000808, partial [Trichomalopsis sarcophagae]